MAGRFNSCLALQSLVAAAFGFLSPPAAAQCVTDWAMHLPPARTDAGMAFDSGRNRLVLFGGTNAGTLRNDTWEFDGVAWTLASTQGPSPRRGHKLVYDAAHRRTLLIGGSASPALPSFQTWAWDGSTWRRVADTGPAFAFTTAAALEAAAAYDPSRGRTVLFLANGETWEWDNALWARAATTGPGARRGAALSYDRSSARIILFGGTLSGTARADTWAWDGLAWAPLPASGPPARSDARMAFDPVARRVLIHGGAPASGPRLRDTWAYNGTTWAPLASTGPTTPCGLAGNCMAFDSVRARLILLGGAAGPLADTASFDGAAWSQPAVSPTARSAPAAAYDPARARLVLFGGLGAARLGDTWEFDGGTWSLASTTGPAPRSDHAMAYDPLRGRTVLFGGTADSGAQADTWEWNGLTWTRVNIPGPSARERHAMTFDPITQRVMFHGGSSGGSETWLYDGSSWSRAANGPTRAGHAIAHHPASARVILYGGSGAGTGQTAWGWDGLSWAAIGGPGPSTAIEHSLTADPFTGGLVLIGPSAGDTASWTFDGAAWRRAITPATPAGAGPRARNNHAAWFDARRGRVCMFGGTAASSPSAETWEFRGVAGPALISTPTWAVSCQQGSADFTVRVAPGSPVGTVAWFRDGEPVNPGPTAGGSTVTVAADAAAGAYTLSITALGPADAGFYRCALTNPCAGLTLTNPAGLSLCAADFDCSGSGSGDGVSEGDIFAFLGAFFAGEPRADMNRDGEVSVEDVFEFLAMYFAGC